MLANMLMPAKPEARVSRHEDALHLRKDAHGVTSNGWIGGGSRLPAVLERTTLRAVYPTVQVLGSPPFTGAFQLQTDCKSASVPSNLDVSAHARVGNIEVLTPKVLSAVSATSLLFDA